MISSIFSTSTFLQVTYNPGNPYIANNGPGFGTVRYNPNDYTLEAFDGNYWHKIANNMANISLSFDAEETLRWIKEYRFEVEKEKKLRENNQAVKNAWEQYQVIKTLAEKMENA